MNREATIIVFVVRNKSLIIGIEIFPEKKIIVNRLIIIILAYSAIKIRANAPLLYSVLNPETSSDSPSAKSNGVRFVSASKVVNQIIISGSIISVGHEKLFLRMKFISKDDKIINADRRVRTILTS